MKRLALAAATAAALVTAAPAAAGPQYYFSCVADSKVQNNQAHDWSTTKPSASFQSGAGCGTLDPGIFTTRSANQKMDFYGGGKHTGPINAINVELHSLLLSQVRVPDDMGVEAELLIDGEDVLEGVKEFRITPVTSATGLTQAFTFSFAREPQFDENGEELPARPIVAGTGDHTIEVRFSSMFIDYQNLWVWGASEIPAHVEINPAALSAPTLFGPA